MFKSFMIRIFSMLLVFITVFGMISGMPVSAAENYNGGWAMTLSQQNVYTSTNGETRVGSVFAYEGFTVLERGNGYFYIQYSTSSGPKEGYILNTDDTYDEMLNATCVAKVTTSSSLYYGPNTVGYERTGSVSAGELVCILAKNGDWVYVEYNTNQGRKRGYMTYSCLTAYNPPAYFYDIYTYIYGGNSQYISGTKTVYSGPSDEYVAVGSISDEYVLWYASWGLAPGSSEYWYIVYDVDSTGLSKSGWIRIDY